MLGPARQDSSRDVYLERSQQRKIGGRKSKANNFCCKRELVATGDQVMVGIATN